MVQRRVSVVTAAVVLVGSLVSLVGWSLGVFGLAGAVPGSRAVNPNASLVLALVSAGLLMRALTRTRMMQVLVLALALAAAAIGSAAVSASLGGPGGGLPMLFEYGSPGTAPSQAVVGSVLLALALCLSRTRTRRGRWLLLACAGVPAMLGAMAMIGQLYGADPLFQPFGSRVTAPVTAVALQLLAFGTMVAWMPTRAWELLTAPVPTNVVLRRVWPASLLVLVVVGYAALRASQAGVLSDETEVAIIVVVNGFVLTLLMVWVGLRLNRSVLEAREAREEADAATAAMHAQALDLNEEVVQKLAVAWLAHDTGDTQLTHRSVQDALEHAQRITRQLLEADRETIPQPGEFRRSSRPDPVQGAAVDT